MFSIFLLSRDALQLNGAVKIFFKKQQLVAFRDKEQFYF